MNPTRFARNASTVAVASIAAWSSWSHMVHVALTFGERPEVAYVLPISVDGMLIVASTEMMDDKRAGRPVRWSARTAFLAGVGASVAANIAAAQPTLGARIVAAWPAVALLLVVEMLSRARQPDMSKRVASSPREGGTASPLGKAGQDDAAPDAASATEKSMTARTSDAPSRSRTPGPRRQHGERTSDALLRIQAERPDASLTDIATHLGVTERHVRRLLNSALTESE
ncbi:DUF2637 domain-containing protein [Micromonospora sp. MS34]|uniref:DUF2637 domain-containing protein n=1 Tax=Micromonospora sp. MS34 TaxID=3385971 RepID=UPI0039A32E9A